MSMSLLARMLLLVSVLILFAVAATAVPLTVNSRATMLDEEREEAARLAQVVAESAGHSDQAWRDVEGAIGRQMVVQAAVTAEFVAAAEDAGMRPGEISDRLRSVTRRTELDEFWVTDPGGRAYIHTVPGIDFTFSPDRREQRQASMFWPLLTGERDQVIQRAKTREVDDRVFKYVGVGGVDQPRIVQVGYEARYLAGLRRQVGLVQLVEHLAGTGGVVAVRVVNRRLGTRVVRSGTGEDPDEQLSESEASILREAEQAGAPRSFDLGEALTVAAPIHAEGGGEDVIGGVLVTLATTHVRDKLRDDLILAVAIGIAVLALGLGAALAGARRLARPVGEVTAAAGAVEDGTYEPGSLDPVAARRDEIGRLAQVFDRMAREVRAREQRLQSEIKNLTVQIDEGKRQRQVAEVTETDYFKDLQRRAEELREPDDEEDS